MKHPELRPLAAHGTQVYGPEEATMIGKTMTRKELYDLVWATPMRTLAPEFHLSDVGLAKLCRRHAIPLPERGYWAKKEHGKKVSQPSLPPVTDARLDTIRIYIPEHTEADIPAEDDPEVASWVERERAPEHEIVVPSDIRKYHPLVAATRRWFVESRKPFVYGVKREHIDHLHVNVTQDAEARVLLLWETIIRACEKRGWSVETKSSDRESTTTITVLGEKVRVFIEERRDRKPHELTPKEQKSEAEGRTYGIAKHDYFGTNILKLTIDEYYGKTTFADRKDCPLEAQLNDFMIALVRTAIVAVRPSRIEAEENHRRWEEQQRRAQIEERRRSQFAELLTHWAKHEEGNACLAAVEEALGKNSEVAANPDVVEWLAWARQHVVRVNPIRAYMKAIVSGKAMQAYCYPPFWNE